VNALQRHARLRAVRAISRLEGSEPISYRTLAKELGRSLSSTFAMVRALEQLGLVEIARCGECGRETGPRLTEAGRAFAGGPADVRSSTIREGR